MEEIISAKGINKKISFAPDASLYLYRDGNLTVNKGEFAVITGRSGCGKSALLNILTGFDKQSEGTVLIDNVNIRTLNQAELEKFRSENISLCCTDKSPVDLILTIRENIYRRLQCFKKSNLNKEVNAILKTFNLTPICNQKVLPTTSHYFRLMLAMAFCGPFPFIFIDEILDYFPPDERDELLETILAMQKKHQITICAVSVNTEILTRADRAFYIKDQTIYKVDLNKFRALVNAK